MKKSQKQNCPWLGTDGKVLDDKAIRQIAAEQNWDQETWDQFLDATIEAPQREELTTPTHSKASPKTSQSVWCLGETSLNDEDSAKIKRLIGDYLTPRQQQIIRLIFWESMSERNIAELMNVTRSTVAVQKRRSLRKLKDLVSARLPEMPIDVGIESLLLVVGGK